MVDAYVAFVSYIAIFGTVGLLAASAVVLALPTVVALFSKFEGLEEEVILIRPNSYDEDEDR